MFSRTIKRSIGPTWRASTRSFHGSSRTESRGGRAIAVLCAGTIAAVTLWTRPFPKIRADGQSMQPTQPSTLPLGTYPKPFHDVTNENIQAAKREFLQVLGEEGVNENPAELQTRSSTEWSPSPVDRTAALIVFPKTTEHVSQIMKICHRRNIPVTPFSGGTSLDGALAATRGGVCIDFGQMNRILSLHENDLDVVVQPAVGWQDLNEYLKPRGLYFPVDPGPGAQIGGMIATGCSGTNAYRYGPMRNWVISATVVLADGTIVKTRQRPRKSTAGYDLTRLMVSSSGTLGLVTEATLQVTAVPKNEQVAVVAFPSCEHAVRTAIEMIQSGVQTEALELMDETAMRASNNSGYLTHEYKEVPTLFMKFAGPTPEVVRKQVSVVRGLSEKHGSQSFETSSDPDTIEELWGARKTILWNLIASRNDPDDKNTSCDVAVPISDLPKIIGETTERMKQAGLLGSCVGHVGDGNFHTLVYYNESQKEAAESIILWCRRRGIELEGTVTGEHGIGLTLRDLLTEEVGVNATDMMRKIKFALDPKCLLACDKVIRIEEGEDH